MATQAIGARRLSAERLFYLGMGLAILLTVFAGFAPSFYLRGIIQPYAPMLPTTPLVLLHGLLFSGWIVLFIAQTSLMSTGRADLHRRLGLIGFAMLAAMIVVGTLAALHGVERKSGPPIVPPLAWLAVPLLDVPVFAALIGLGLANRRKPQVHKRFMLVATIGMLPPAIGRLPWPPDAPFPLVLIGGQLLFLSALAGWDFFSRRRLHWVTIAGTVLLVGSWLFRFAIWQTEPWLAFARWAAGLVA